MAKALTVPAIPPPPPDRDEPHYAQPVQLAPDVLRKLREHFPDHMVKADVFNAKPDGFVPSYIPWDQIASRLDDVFGGMWQFTIVSWQIVMNCEAVVHGRFEATATQGGLHYILVKDGIGTKILTTEGNRFTSIGDDIKAAATDALKRAVILLGVGTQLYQRGVQKVVAAQGPANFAPNSLHFAPVAPLTATNA